jgi:hypothetical protein
LKFDIGRIGPRRIEDDIIPILVQALHLYVLPGKTGIGRGGAPLEDILVSCQVEGQAVHADTLDRQIAGHGPLFLVGEIGDHTSGSRTEATVAVVPLERGIAKTHNRSQNAQNYQKLQDRERS